MKGGVFQDVMNLIQLSSQLNISIDMTTRSISKQPQCVQIRQISVYGSLLSLVYFIKTTFNSFNYLIFSSNQLKCSSLMFLNFCPTRFAILHQQNEKYDSSNLE